MTTRKRRTGLMLLGAVGGLLLVALLASRGFRDFVGEVVDSDVERVKIKLRNSDSGTGCVIKEKKKDKNNPDVAPFRVKVDKDDVAVVWRIHNQCKDKPSVTVRIHTFDYEGPPPDDDDDACVGSTVTQPNPIGQDTDITTIAGEETTEHRTDVGGQEGCFKYSIRVRKTGDPDDEFDPEFVIWR